MSSVATAPAASPTTPLRRLLASSIGHKILMAATGVILSGFVVAHMSANLLAFVDPAALDGYGEALRKAPALLWGARIVLFSSVCIHVGAWIVLVRRNASARPVGYRKATYKESSYASRTMKFTGPLILAFVLFHLLHMTTGTVHPRFEEGKVYRNVVTGLTVLPVALFYLAAMSALAFHLWHGIWSLFQTLGCTQPRYLSIGRRVATVVSLVVSLGFAAVPLAVLAGLLK